MLMDVVVLLKKRNARRTRLDEVSTKDDEVERADEAAGK